MSTSMCLPKMISLVLLICLGGLTSCGVTADQNPDDGFTEVTETYELETLQTDCPVETRETECPVETTATQIYVYVCGAVKHPGVYPLAADARCYQALAMAGGPTDEGCTDYLELAKPAEDGQRLYVPTEEEVSQRPDGSLPGEVLTETTLYDEGRVNINTADLQTLMTLPGIGEAKAQRIIEYRSIHGAFESIEALEAVSGIGASTLEGLKDLVTT